MGPMTDYFILKNIVSCPMYLYNAKTIPMHAKDILTYFSVKKLEFIEQI